ncbi:zinc-binding dehydrogenase [Streptomyces chartreusis]|uniref:zinc-binding dehydrogenase n=1 Tax=Streptomyces chartreusis TaxID=1969 RepID=UPI00362F9BFD
MVLSVPGVAVHTSGDCDRVRADRRLAVQGDRPELGVDDALTVHVRDAAFHLYAVSFEPAEPERETGTPRRAADGIRPAWPAVYAALEQSIVAFIAAELRGLAAPRSTRAAQIAAARGAEVYATVSASKAPLVRKLGATPIDHTTTSVEEYVAQYTGGAGFDVVFDTVGGPVLDASFEAVRTYSGHVVSALGWGTHSLAPLSFRGATYSGVFTLLPMLTGSGREHHGQILREAAALSDSGGLRPLLDPQRYRLATVTEAHAAVENGTASGKVVIDIEQ